MDGHVKLTDFGLSKEQFYKNSRTFSFCGSPEYMSPEMLTGTGHGQMLDIYSLGALLFEMLTGLPPHYSQNRQEMYYRIVNEEIYIPDYLSRNATDLLAKLLNHNQMERLGKNGFNEIKLHPFFNGINWDDILAKKIKPPFTLSLSQSYFDPSFTNSSINWSEGDDLNNARERSQSNFELLLMDTIIQNNITNNQNLEQSADKCLTGKAGNRKHRNIQEFAKEYNKITQDSKKAKTDRNKLKFDTLPKLLFQGYAFSKDSATIYNASKHQRKRSRFQFISRNIVPLNNVLSIKMKYNMGESNDPFDEDLSDMSANSLYESPSPIKKEMLDSVKKQRSKSPSNEIKLNLKKIDEPSYRGKSNSFTNITGKLKKIPLIKQNTFKLKQHESRTNILKMRAVAETTRLIKQKQSKAGESLIRLNDAINDVYSERVRPYCAFKVKNEKSNYATNKQIAIENSHEILELSGNITERIMTKNSEKDDMQKRKFKKLESDKNIGTHSKKSTNNFGKIMHQRRTGKNSINDNKNLKKSGGEFNKTQPNKKILDLSNINKNQRNPVPVKVNKIELLNLQPQPIKIFSTNLVRNKSINVLNTKILKQKSKKSQPKQGKNSPSRSPMKSMIPVLCTSGSRSPANMENIAKSQSEFSRNQPNKMMIKMMKTKKINATSADLQIKIMKNKLPKKNSDMFKTEEIIDKKTLKLDKNNMPIKRISINLFKKGKKNSNNTSTISSGNTSLSKLQI